MRDTMSAAHDSAPVTSAASTGADAAAAGTAAGPASPEEPPARAISTRRERTRERLLEAAFTVFSRHGVQGASIEAICEAAGFTRGAFYSNFSTKEELYLAVIDRDVRRRLDALERTVDDLGVDAVAGDRVTPRAIDAILRGVTPEGPDQRDWHLVITEFELMAMRDAEVAAAHLAQKERIAAELRTVIERVLGRLGMEFAIDPEVAVELLEQVYLAQARQELLSGEASSAMTELAQLLLRPRRLLNKAPFWLAT